MVDLFVRESFVSTDTNMLLTDLAIKRALSGPTIVKLSDGGGLQLWLTPDGAKRWRLRLEKPLEKTWPLVEPPKSKQAEAERRAASC